MICLDELEKKIKEWKPSEKKKKKKNPSPELRRHVRHELDEVGARSTWLGKGDEV